MASQIRAPNSVLSVSPGDIAWTNPSNAKVEDATLATASLGPVVTTTEYLKALDFSFSITGLSIDGIVARIKKSASALDKITDNAVRLVKGGVISSTDRADTTHWPTTLTIFTYGSASDLWGESPTVSDVNGSGFGVAISALWLAAAAPQAGVDYIELEVFYTADSGSRSVKRRQPKRLEISYELDTY